MSTELLRQLYQVRTYGELYSLPFPVVVAPLQKTELFASFQDDAKWSATDRHLPEEMTEVTGLSMMFDLQAGWSTHQDWIFLARRHYREAENNNTDDIHPDCISEPRRRIFFAASMSGTEIVTHSDTLDILQRDPDARPVLDTRIGEAHLNEFLSHMYRLRPQFREAAQPTGADTIHLMSGGTLHRRPANPSPERVFYKGLSFIAD